MADNFVNNFKFPTYELYSLNLNKINGYFIRINSVDAEAELPYGVIFGKLLFIYSDNRILLNITRIFNIIIFMNFTFHKNYRF